jgi:type I restriction enzyme S subunit
MSITDFRPFINKLPNQWDIKAFHEILSEPVKNGVYKTKGFHGSGVKIINMGELFSYNFISHQDMRRIELTQ